MMGCSYLFVLITVRQSKSSRLELYRVSKALSSTQIKAKIFCNPLDFHPPVCILYIVGMMLIKNQSFNSYGRATRTGKVAG